MEGAIEIIDDGRLEADLRDHVIDLWENIESQFDSERKTKKR